jgi:hypothetical protein
MDTAPKATPVLLKVMVGLQNQHRAIVGIWRQSTASWMSMPIAREVAEDLYPSAWAEIPPMDDDEQEPVSERGGRQRDHAVA